MTLRDRIEYEVLEKTHPDGDYGGWKDRAETITDSILGLLRQGPTVTVREQVHSGTQELVKYHDPLPDLPIGAHALVLLPPEDEPYPYGVHPTDTLPKEDG